MPKIDEGDEVLVRGTIYSIEENGRYGIHFDGYQYPVPVREHAIEKVIKTKHKPKYDKPD